MIDDTLEQAAERALRIHAESKVAACVREGGPCDLNSMVEIHIDDQIYLALLENAELLDTAVAIYEVGKGPAEVIVFLGDAFGKVLGDDERVPRKGELGGMLERGDMDIEYWLMVHAVKVGANEQVIIRQSYSYDDHGMPVLAVPERVPVEMAVGPTFNAVAHYARPRR